MGKTLFGEQVVHLKLVLKSIANDLDLIAEKQKEKELKAKQDASKQTIVEHNEPRRAYAETSAAYFLAEDQCELLQIIDNSQLVPWQKVLSWQVDMINLSLGMISILFENNGRPESITAKFSLNHSDKLEFLP